MMTGAPETVEVTTSVALPLRDGAVTAAVGSIFVTAGIKPGLGALAADLCTASAA